MEGDSGWFSRLEAKLCGSSEGSSEVIVRHFASFSHFFLTILYVDIITSCHFIPPHLLLGVQTLSLLSELTSYFDDFVYLCVHMCRLIVTGIKRVGNNLKSFTFNYKAVVLNMWVMPHLINLFPKTFTLWFIAVKLQLWSSSKIILWLASP